MKLIKLTDNHYVVVDETIDINENDYTFKNGEIRQVSYLMQDNGYIITHSTQPLEDIEVDKYVTKMPIYDKIQQITLSEVKELIGEVNVDKKAEKQLKLIDSAVCLTTTKEEENIYIQGFYNGYNQALEDNKEKKYTEAQLIWAIQEAYGHGQDDEFDGVNKIEESIKAITKHLQSKTEWEVEFIDGKLKLK